MKLYATSQKLCGRRVLKSRFIFLFNPVLLVKGLYHQEEESPRPDELEDV